MFSHKLCQTTPAAADIQHPHAGFQLQFFADKTEFILLRLFKGGRLFPVTAGVLHGGVEHPAEQVITQIVMLFTDDPGALFTLQVEQAGSGDPKRILQVAGQLRFQASA